MAQRLKLMNLSSQSLNLQNPIHQIPSHRYLQSYCLLSVLLV